MNNEKPTEKKAREPLSYGAVLVLLLGAFLFVVAGLPFIFAMAYVLTGFNSIGYYGPPLGQVMLFYQQSAILLATTSTPIFVVAGFLLGIKRIRKYIDKLLERFTTESSKP